MVIEKLALDIAMIFIQTTKDTKKIGKFVVRSTVNLNGVKKSSEFESVLKNFLIKFHLFAGPYHHHMSTHDLVYIHIAHTVLILIDSCAVICHLIGPRDVLPNF